MYEAFSNNNPESIVRGSVVATAETFSAMLDLSALADGALPGLPMIGLMH